MKRPLILISGATATGKTATALKLASLTSGEIINGDSLLFYPELNIGTAKPTPEELALIPHHLINCGHLSEPYNANDYVAQALEAIDNLHRSQKVPIIVGGSAFYIRALLKGMYESGEIDLQVREEINQLEKEKGWHFLREELRKRDPLSYEKVHENDRYRTLRALEFSYTHNRPLSEERQKMEESGPYDFSKLQKEEWALHHIYLDLPKDFHWEIMRKRAYKMIEEGLIEEVQEILNQGFSPELKPLQSIGYKETIQYLQGNLSKEELGERIYINTRRLAKSQKTFFKKTTPKITYHPLNQEESIMSDALTFLKDLNHG